MATTGNFGTVDTDNNAAITAYQWEESDDDISFANVGTILTDTSGELTDTLTIVSATVAMNGTYVRCTVSHLDGPTSSLSALLTVT